MSLARECGLLNRYGEYPVKLHRISVREEPDSADTLHEAFPRALTSADVSYAENSEPDKSVEGSPLELTLLTTICGNGTCPTVYRTNRGTYVVQGYVVPDRVGVDVPEGELLVEIPAELFQEAARSGP